MAPVHLAAVVDYIESLLKRKMTEKEKFTLLELIHFGKSSRKKDEQYFSAPTG